jgi:CheY-like chemotaxis protein
MKPIRILWVEDNENLVSTMKRLLRKLFPGRDVKLERADTSTLAIRLLTSESYHYIISDYMLADGTGVDVLSWIRAQAPLLKNRFCFLTSHDVSERDIQCVSKTSPNLSADLALALGLNVQH